MVYHYTSPEGLKEILQNKSLRFTDCQYMNDKSEFMYIRKPLLKALDECKKELKYKHYNKLIDHAFSYKYGEEAFDYVPPSSDNPKGGLIKSNKRFYIFCASTANDSLGMWNYYVKGKNYQGYNIGIDTKLLVEEAMEESHGGFNYDFTCDEVIYDQKEQISLLTELLFKIDEDIFDYANKYDPKELDNYAEKSMPYTVFSVRLDYSNYRLLFKHPAFADERECRFILKISDAQIEMNPTLFKKDYFVRNGVITPCCLLLFKKESVVNITVSPTMELILVDYSTRSFLKENGYTHNIDIKQSEIPIRY